MKLTGRIELRYDSPAMAEAVRAALAPEDEAFVDARVEGAVLRVRAEADAPEGLLRTLDDYLACVSAAESTLREA